MDLLIIVHVHVNERDTGNQYTPREECEAHTNAWSSQVWNKPVTPVKVSAFFLLYKLLDSY